MYFIHDKKFDFLQVLVLLANVKPMELTIGFKKRKIAFWEEHVLVMTNARLCPIATLTQVKTCKLLYEKYIIFTKSLKIWTENFTKFHFMNHPYYGVDSWPICTLGVVFVCLLLSTIWGVKINLSLLEVGFSAAQRSNIGNFFGKFQEGHEKYFLGHPLNFVILKKVLFKKKPEDIWCVGWYEGISVYPIGSIVVHFREK